MRFILYCQDQNQGRSDLKSNWMNRVIRRIRLRRKSGKPYLFFLLFIFVISFTFTCSSEISSVTIKISHLLYPNYHQTIKVKMYERFQLSDTDLLAAVVEFVPDFAIDTLSKKVISQSSELRNPAFKIYVQKRNLKREEVWAFFKVSVPHFTPQTGLIFEVVEFRYKGKSYKREESQ